MNKWTYSLLERHRWETNCTYIKALKTTHTTIFVRACMYACILILLWGLQSGDEWLVKSMAIMALWVIQWVCSLTLSSRQSQCLRCTWRESFWVSKHPANAHALLSIKTYCDYRKLGSYIIVCMWFAGKPVSESKLVCIYIYSRSRREMAMWCTGASITVIWRDWSQWCINLHTALCKYACQDILCITL